MTASQTQPQSQLPELIEETIVALRLRHSFYGSEVLLSNLVRSLNMCNEQVQLVRRPFCEDTGQKNEDGDFFVRSMEISYIYAMKCGRQVFDIEGHLGWDEILKEYLHARFQYGRMPELTPHQWAGSEQSDFPVETSDKMVGEMIEAIAPIQARLQKVVLIGETQDISSSKTTTQKKM